MSLDIIVGTQWGDEGKGRTVDYLAQSADLVIRFQGGDNAGHTVVNDLGVWKLHIIPSGIFNPNTVCLTGTGTVVNFDIMLQEIAYLEEAIAKEPNNQEYRKALDALRDVRKQYRRSHELFHEPPDDERHRSVGRHRSRRRSRRPVRWRPECRRRSGRSR